MCKNIASLFLLILAVIAMQGCKESLEKAYSLGDNIDPNEPKSTRPSPAAQPTTPIIQCKKERAFGYYCLGSSIKTLLDQRKPLRQHTKGSLTIFDFRERRGLTTITTFQGKILSASRTDRPANVQTLITVKQRIETLYGKSDDRSTFTPESKSARQMEFAVYNKKAKAHYVWPMSGWRIDVIWDNIRDIRVTFLDEDINRAYLSNHKQPQKDPNKI